MAPLVRRTLAPRGRTPILVQPGSRRKISAIAAVSLSPRRQRLGLHYDIHRNTAIDNYGVANFLRQLLRCLPGRVIVLWDQGRIHQGPGIRQVQADHPRLQLASFPTYAPDLNPVEYLWTYMKWAQLPNYVPQDILHLDDIVCEELYNTCYNQGRLRSFYDASKLPFPTRALAS